MIYGGFYGFFILIEGCFSTFEFEENNLSEIATCESIEYDIIASFSYEHHILRGIWEIRKCWKNLFIELSEYLITRSSEAFFSDFSMF